MGGNGCGKNWLLLRWAGPCSTFSVCSFLYCFLVLMSSLCFILFYCFPSASFRFSLFFFYIHTQTHTYGWFMLRFDRKQQNSVTQLSFNTKIKRRVKNKKKQGLILSGRIHLQFRTQRIFWQDTKLNGFNVREKKAHKTYWEGHHY